MKPILCDACDLAYRSTAVKNLARLFSRHISISYALTDRASVYPALTNE
jgi:hypothetical protein